MHMLGLKLRRKKTLHRVFDFPPHTKYLEILSHYTFHGNVLLGHTSLESLQNFS